MKRFLKIVLRTIFALFILINIIAAFHAYKLTHFYEPGEVTIKADSLESGWEKTGQILFGINAVKKPNDPVADTTYQTVYLTTKDRIKLNGWYASTDSEIGTVLLFHGHGGNKSGTTREAVEFRKLGYNTFQLDFRAHGSSGGNTCTIGTFEAEDVKLAYDFAVNHGDKNIILWGISMGAATITKAMYDYDLKPSKVILEMPFGSIEQAVKGRLRMLHMPQQPLATLLTFWGGTEHGFWAFSNKPSEYVRKITCPVLLQWGRNDPRVSQEETDDIYSNLPVQKKLVIYENSGHGSLCKSEYDKWIAEVGNFIKQ